jgi:hypothetical protein
MSGGMRILTHKHGMSRPRSTCIRQGGGGRLANCSTLAALACTPAIPTLWTLASACDTTASTPWSARAGSHASMLQGGLSSSPPLGCPHSLQQLLLVPRAVLGRVSRRVPLMIIIFAISWRAPHMPAALAVSLEAIACSPGAAMPGFSTVVSSSQGVRIQVTNSSALRPGRQCTWGVTCGMLPHEAT